MPSVSSLVLILALAVVSLAGAVLPRESRAAAPATDDEKPRHDLAEGDGTADKLLFERNIRPILVDRCGGCHGAEKRLADLDVRSPASLVHGGESGPVVVAGSADESLLWQRIAAREMPPEDQPQLEDRERDAIRRWIDSGASFEQPAATEKAVTEQDVLPILLLRCTTCHGTRRQEGGLDLRSREAILAGGKSGPAAIPGKPESSLVVQRVRAGEMPPRRQLVKASVKPMEPHELAVIERWIGAGMPELDASRQDPAADRLVSDEDRRFWSFQPPKQPPIPHVRQRGRVATPIDAFIVRRLEQHGVRPATEADRQTLLRRLSFDLTGLPPTPEAVAAFLNDDRPRAYERLVERLLASPDYGERWGRHWLDVAGYADSEGAQNEDRVRPHMWRYRDYVIRAFNADKPYDRMLLEQIAGDELADYRNAGEITPAIYDNLTATGFLRTAPDRTFAGITNFVPDRLEVIADEIRILGSAVLGLTVQCARCHSHKFDPIPQRDYYRLTAALKDALDEHDWLKPAERVLKQVTSEERREWEQRQAELDAQLDPLRKQRETEKDADRQKALDEQIAALEARRDPEPAIRALWSRGEPSPSFVLLRGNHLTPGRPVDAGVPAVLTAGDPLLESQPPWPDAETTGRRLALARWLAQSDHPLTARVLVNRVWKHHFGRGLVETLDNFGHAGARPSHPELLDWLAVEFTRQGWSIKALHRLMLNSRTYRQSSAARSDEEGFSDEQLAAEYARMPMRRLEAEPLRDTLLAVAGELNRARFGPPRPVDADRGGLVTSRSDGQGRRRSIYVLQRRTQIPTLLESFDFPQMGPNCVERDESIVAPQALHMLNNQMVYQLAERFAERVEREVGDRPERQVTRVHWLALSRPPRVDERNLAVDALTRLKRQWIAALSSKDAADAQGVETAESVEARAARRALVNYCHAVINSAAFLYVD